MRYNTRHQTLDTRHQRWQLNVLDFFKFHFSRVFYTEVTCNTNPLNSKVRTCYQVGLIAFFKQPTLLLFFKTPIVLIFFLLVYSCNALALSAATAQPINGSLPYVTFDGGKTKLTSTRSLLEIKLPDGTVITPDNNDSTFEKPIIFRKFGGSFADIEMVVPPTRDNIKLSEVIGEPYNFWGDDDGDGKGIGGIIATGDFNVRIEDNTGFLINRNTVLDICDAPYKVILSYDGGTLSTQYGLPNNRVISREKVTYYIQPNGLPKVCYAYPGSIEKEKGHAPMWYARKGFVTQSETLYGENFPTTGSNNLFFDLKIGGTSPLTWSTVTKDGITATVTPTPRSKTNMRVTLTGPIATNAQMVASQPGRIAVPNLPLTFELVGKNSEGYPVLKYGFVLQKWFVTRGNVKTLLPEAQNWCSSIGYRIMKVNDYTNAVNPDYPDVISAIPSSTIPGIMVPEMRIKGGLYSEWGSWDYGISDLRFFMTSDVHKVDDFPFRMDVITAIGGFVSHNENDNNVHTMCVYP